MIIDMQFSDSVGGIMAYPDWIFTDVFQSSNLEEVTTVQGSSSATTISMTGSIGGV